MARSGDGGCCLCCIGFMITSGITSLFLWLGLHVANPICSIQDIYIPVLNKTASSTSNTTIYFDLKLDNPNWNKGIYYDDLYLTFNYSPNRTSFPIGNMTIQHFYQGNKKKAHRRELLETHGVQWEAVLQRVSNRTVIFRVDLATEVRYKIVRWKTKRHALVVGADVEVNESGNKVERKGIRLTSGTSEIGSPELTILLLYFVLFHLCISS